MESGERRVKSGEWMSKVKSEECSARTDEWRATSGEWGAGSDERRAKSGIRAPRIEKLLSTFFEVAHPCVTERRRIVNEAHQEALKALRESHERREATKQKSPAV